MTKEETKQILSILKINYPQSFKDWSVEQATKFLELWAEAFKNENVAVVTAAVKSIIYGDTREFAPNIGQVKEKVYKLKNPIEVNEDDVWNEVMRALRNSGRNAEEEFNKLSEFAKAGVGSPANLRDWALTDTNTVITVIASNFKRGLRSRIIYKKEHDMLPAEIKKMIENSLERVCLK